jgi:hypothetical protein
MDTSTIVMILVFSFRFLPVGFAKFFGESSTPK